MRALRAIFFVCLSLLFVFSTNRCVIAAALPANVEECCPDEQAPGESDSGAPCSGRDCSLCVLAVGGANVSAQGMLTVCAPVWAEDQGMAELVRRLAAAAVVEVPVAIVDVESMRPPAWFDVMKKALPVRGPSLAA